MEYRSVDLPLLIWTQFHTLFFEKYVPYTFCEHKGGFLDLMQGSMYVASYKDKVYIFSHYATQFISTKEERI